MGNSFRFDIGPDPDQEHEKDFQRKLESLEKKLSHQLEEVRSQLKKALEKPIDQGIAQQIIDQIAESVRHIIQGAKDSQNFDQLKIDIQAIKIRINDALAEFQPKPQAGESAEKILIAGSSQHNDQDLVRRFLTEVEKTVNQVEKAVS